MADARRERDRQLRQLADQAQGVNLDLGQSLLNGLSTIDPNSVELAKFYVYSTLGGDHSSGYGQAGQRIRHLALAGIRLIVGELRTDVTKTRNYPDCPVMPTLVGSVGVWLLVGDAGGGPVGISRS